MNLATVIHGSTTLASFETSRWAYIFLGLVLLALLVRGNISVRLSLLVGIAMGILLPAFFSGVSTWTRGFPSKHLGSGPGLAVTFVLFAILVFEGIVFFTEHQRAQEEA